MFARPALLNVSLLTLKKRPRQRNRKQPFESAFAHVQIASDQVIGLSLWQCLDDVALSTNECPAFRDETILA
jgi:hypothetical protein